MSIHSTVCENNKCTGCMLCKDLCPKKAINVVDSLRAYNAVIDETKCINCNLCHTTCQNNKNIKLTHPMSWVQGWINDDELRKKSSSGGAAAALSRAFVSTGGIVCSCCFIGGEFKFEFAKSIDDLEKFVGSKYVKSNPAGVYKAVKNEIKNGNKVLFIGLPCQVAAVKEYIESNRYSNNLYTVDLICHGTPSPKLLQDYLSLHHINMMELKNIFFRNKGVFGLEQNMIPISQPGSVDNYSLAFLCSLDYTDNCYDCKFAGIKRGSDITIGDSWDSDLSKEEQRKGISIILCQTEKGEQLLKSSDMKLFPVDLEHAICVNDQLREPSAKTAKHDLFFDKYPARSFNYATFCCLPFKCVKQRIKALLLKIKVFRGGINYNLIITKLFES